jgi:hypothetical protein
MGNENIGSSSGGAQERKKNKMKLSLPPPKLRQKLV